MRHAAAAAGRCWSAPRGHTFTGWMLAAVSLQRGSVPTRQPVRNEHISSPVSLRRAPRTRVTAGQKCATACVGSVRPRKAKREKREKEKKEKENKDKTDR